MQNAEEHVKQGKNKRQAKPSLEQLVERCRKLRAKAELAAADFLLGLMEIEAQYMEVLRDNGCDTFERFLRSYHICDPARYRDFCAGVGVIGRMRARRIGEHATREAARFRNMSPQKVEKLVLRAEAFETRNGVKPSAAEARRYRAELEAPRVTGIRTASKLAALEAENRELRAELRACKKELEREQKRRVRAEGRVEYLAAELERKS